MVGEMAVERSTQLLLLTWTGVDSRHGSTADQGRTGRKDSSSRLWRPARSLGTHAKQSPSTGHSAVGLHQVGNSLLTPRPHFTAPSCTLGNQVVGASDGPPFRQESRPTRICETPGTKCHTPSAFAALVGGTEPRLSFESLTCGLFRDGLQVRHTLLRPPSDFPPILGPAFPGFSTDR
jgi:hypothetical protein